ncbi:MAG: lipopolysaccharide biosynthesis protein [Clostridia bacterium]|nr:lipopolysaccharide biosynthesis protein [Clostridia bacterium]
MEDTKQKVFSNMIWRFAERVGAQIVAFVVSIVLARILAPEDYGTIALITVFTTIMQVLVDSGLGNSLIQKKDADDIDFSTVFYTNIVFCLILYVIIFFAAPLIAKFYSNDSLIALTRVLGLTIVISGVKNVQQAYVSRNLIFKKFFFATLCGTIGAAIVGITMALNGFGVWALVAQQLFNLTVDTIILWITVKWRPKKVFSFERLKKLFSYGWKLLASSVIDTVYNNIRQLLIGRLYSSSDLAYYNRGKQFPDLIVNNVNTSIDSVLLPTMSNVQDDKQKIREMTRKSIRTSMYIMAPLMMGLAFASKNIVTFVLTEKWLPAVPFLVVFCISYMFYPIHTANLNAIKAMGRSDLFLKLEIIKKIVGVILLLATMFISVEAMAYSLLASSLLSQIINSWPNKKLLNYSYLQQLKDIIPTLVLATIMGLIVFLFNFLNLNVIIELILQVLVGATVYIIGSLLLKIDTLNFLLDTLKSLIKSKKKQTTV